MSAKFKQLLKEVRECRLCEEHLPNPAKPILQAHPKAVILIAGQAPGTKAHESGVPFNDASGDRLREWMGIDRTTFYDSSKIAILPMGFCYPGKGTSGDLPPRPECEDAWREQLLQGLPRIGLTLIMGQYALKYHLGDRQKRTLTETVKAWKDYFPEGLLPLPHPSPRNNLWLRKNPWFEKEVLGILRRRVKSLLRSTQ